MQKQQLYKGPNHGANLNNMRLQDKLCDITIKVSDREFRAHKVILAANLRYFGSMLSNDAFRESKEGVITMESVDAADFEEFVSYAYTSEILLTDSNALNLLELANYLGEEGIKQACIEFLKKHLRQEEACRAYRFANNIDSPSLKSAAKTTIIGNFENCSKSADYLGLDYESLAGILSNGREQPSEIQKMLFEGILRWIVHDAKDRKIHVNDLLGTINITELTADDILDYLYENKADRNDKHGIMKDIMFYYQTIKIEQKIQKSVKVEQKKQGHALITMGGDVHKHYFQLYNFTEKKWSFPQHFPDAGGGICSNGAILNDEFYYIIRNSKENHLQVFNPTTRQEKRWHSSSSILRFLYLCGGYKEDNSRSDQVLRYDPQTNSFETLSPMGTKRAIAAAIFYGGCLHVLGGCDNAVNLNTVERYDPGTKKWTALAPMKQSRRRFGVAVLDGKLYACGGSGNNSVEVYEPAKNSWQLVSSMNRSRCDFTAVAHEGKLLAIGGDAEKSVEVYDPSMDRWQIDDGMSSGLGMSHPTGGFISSSCIAGAT